MAAIESVNDSSKDTFEEYYNQQLADLFGEAVLMESQNITMSEMFKHVNELDDCMRRLREVTTVGFGGDEYQSIINTLGPTLSVALCKWIADGWAFDTKH